MSFCFVFSGTSEGRILCEELAKKGVNSLVFVATEYGNSVMEKNENISVSVGRLEAHEIKKLIEENNPDYIFDATHPHAEIITRNILKACEDANVSEKYVRISRNIDDTVEDDTIIKVSSILEAIDKIKKYSDGNIMLTTGVKELNHFTQDGIVERLVVRILPFRESIDEATKCNIPAKRIIAMEGPFSEEMNIALIKEYGCKILVTKNSGDRGGYLEKINACRKSEIKAIVIEKPSEKNKGISIDEAVKLYESIDLLTSNNTAIFTANDIENSNITNDDKVNNIKENKDKKIFLIGVGVCEKDYLTRKAIKTIESADLVIGAARMTEFAKSFSDSVRIVNEYMPEAVKDEIDNCSEKKIAVLFSGDTGLCSGAKKVYEILKDKYEVEIIPGISSVSYFASKTGIQYSDYPFISFHGKDIPMDELKSNGMNIFESGFLAICSGVNDVRNIAGKILEARSSRQIVAGFNLGMADEEIRYINHYEDMEDFSEGLYIIALV